MNKKDNSIYYAHVLQLNLCITLKGICNKFAILPNIEYLFIRLRLSDKLCQFSQHLSNNLINYELEPDIDFM